jgi:hypothetical protein
MKAIDRIRADDRVSDLYKDPPDGWWMSLKAGYAFEPSEPPYSGQHTTSELRVSDLAKWLRNIQRCECASCIGMDPGEAEDAIAARSVK